MNRPVSRRGFLAGAAGFAALPFLANCSGSGGGGSAGGGGTPITVGYNGDGNGASTAAAAEKLDLWKKHGLDATAKVFNNGPIQIQALGAGDLDFGFIGPGALWLPMTGKAKIVSIVSNGKSDRVIAQKGIGTIQDLRGKTVGVPEGTSGDMLLSLALKKAGMQMSDVKRVAMDPTTIISAFTAGQIEGAAIWYPHVATIQKRKPDLVEVVKSDDFPELAFPSCLVAGPKITEKPDLLKKFQQVAKEANQWKHDHEDELLDLLAKFLKAPKDGLATEQQFTQVLSTD